MGLTLDLPIHEALRGLNEKIMAQSEEAIRYQEDTDRSLKPRKLRYFSHGHIARIQVHQLGSSYFHNMSHHISDCFPPSLSCLKSLCAPLLPPTPPSFSSPSPNCITSLDSSLPHRAPHCPYARLSLEWPFSYSAPSCLFHRGLW